MSNRVSFKDRKKKDNEKEDSFFKNTAKEEVKNEAIESEEIKRQTYYITKLVIKAISLKSAYEDIDKSLIVRNALEAYIEPEYLEKAKKSFEK